MATLVIGLSDFTMINMKGFDCPSMNEILQIVVQALLRINLDYKPSCCFVHQGIDSLDNPEVTNASAKLKTMSLLD